MSGHIEISTDTATQAYAVLVTHVHKLEFTLSAARSSEDKLFWGEVLASNQAARDELAQQLFPLSHPKKVA